VIGSARSTFGTQQAERADPIALTLVASRLDLSHFVGEVLWGPYSARVEPPSMSISAPWMKSALSDAR
jgi:hypothetical protein